MINLHLRKLRARAAISAEEEKAIRGLVSETCEVRKDEHVVRAFRPTTHSNILLSGIVCRHKDLRDGSRQITSLHIAGDFTDLHSFTLKHLDHDILALTRCTLAIVPHERLHSLTERHPRLGRIYWFLTNLDAAIHREWELSLGRRSARAALAHIFCEMEARLEAVGLAENGRFRLPVVQEDLAECLGLTPVHVNRTLQELRGDGLIAFRSGNAEILDRDRLHETAEFNPGYLYLERMPH